MYKKYENVPITLLQTGEIVVALIEVYTENGREVAYFTADVMGRLDYEEMFDIQVGENEFPFKRMHVGHFTDTFPVRMEMFAKQVGTFSTGMWEKMLGGIANGK